MADYYKDSSEIEAVVEGFEAGTSSKDDFSHQSHLTVAVFYLHHLGELEATGKMRSGLLRFLDHHDVGRVKFHETLTVFWIKTVAEFLCRMDPATSMLEKTNKVVERLGNSRLVFAYYSEELLRTDEARNYWIEPDLKRL